MSAMISALVRSMRPAQWAKNLFVLAPLVFAERLGESDAIVRSLVAFALFCCASSAVYLFNDIHDREEDRRHPRKAKRPIASGRLGLGVAWAASFALAVAALGVGWVLEPAFAGVVALYLGLNAAYTLGLKHLVILDVMIVSAGFVLRVEAGGVAIAVEVSSWLLLCTVFLSLFLVFSKRRHEIQVMSDRAAEQRPVMSHYSATFLDQMINVVTASTVVSYALYAVSPETVERFQSRGLLYTVPMVLFGIFRYLYLMYQRPGDANPTEVILTDPPLVIDLMLWSVAVVAVIYFSR